MVDGRLDVVKNQLWSALAADLEPDRLRLLKNRDSDYLAILAIFQDYQLPILPKSSLFFRLLLDYQLPISRKVIGNLDYQLLILSNRSGSKLNPFPGISVSNWKGFHERARFKVAPRTSLKPPLRRRQSEQTARQR